MRVLIVAEHASDAVAATAPAVRVGIGLRQAGAEVFVLLMCGEGLEDGLPGIWARKRREPGMTVLMAGPLPPGEGTRDEKQRAIARRNLAHLLERESRRIHPDLLHAFGAVEAGFVASLAAAVHCLPHVISVQERDLASDVFHESRSALVRRAFEQATHLVFPDPYLQCLAGRLFPIQEKSSVILPSVFWAGSRAAAEARIVLLGTAPHARNVIALAQTIVRLGLPCPLEVVLMHEDDPPAGGELPGASHGFRVRVATSKDTAAALNGVDVVVAPVADVGLTSALLKAQAAGCIVLVPADLAALVRNGETGFVLADDSLEIHQQIDAVLRDASIRASVGARARAFAAAHLTPEAEARAYLALYERLTRGHAPENPAVDRPARLSVFKPSVSKSEQEELSKALESRWWIYGPRARTLEQRAQALLGCTDALACTSGTAALHLALLAAGVGPGDEVIVPALSFVSTAMVVLYVGATPVFADVDDVYLQLDPQQVAAHLTDRTRAVILTHYSGMPGPIAEVQRVVDGRGIPVVEDAAHAFGARYHGRPIGSGSPFVCFSLSAVKNVAAGEGGLLCFADAALRPRLEALSWLGLTRDTVTKSSAALNEPARVLTVGYKYRMPDLFAALALAQLDRLEELNSRRRKLASAYLEALSAVPEVELPRVRPQTESSWHMFVIRVPVDARDSLRIALASRDIETSVHYPPLNEEPLFQGGHRTPIAAREARRILTLPLFPDMSLADVTRVCGAICDFFRGER